MYSPRLIERLGLLAGRRRARVARPLQHAGRDRALWRGAARGDSMTLDEFRSRFPILKRRVYVNSCSQGALSTDVDEAMRAYLSRGTSSARRGRCGWSRSSAFARGSPPSIGAGRRRDRGDCRAHRPGSTPSPARSPFAGPRSHVVIGDFEFPTMAQIWLAQERRGATIRLGPRRIVVADTLPLDALRRRHRRAHADRSRDARLLPQRPQDRHRRPGAAWLTIAARYVFLDDYQRTGSGPIDVHALGVDFMVTGCLKYLLAAAGIGFLYVRRELIERFEPTITGWFGRVNPFAFRIDDARLAGRRQPVRERNAAGAERLRRPAGTRSARADGVRRDWRAGRAPGRPLRVSRARGWISSSARRSPQTAADRWSSCRASTPLRSCRSSPARGIIASCRGNGLRVSFHAYNTDEDVDAVMSALVAESALLERSTPVAARGL